MFWVMLASAKRINLGEICLIDGRATPFTALRREEAGHTPLLPLPLSLPLFS